MNYRAVSLSLFLAAFSLSGLAHAEKGGEREVFHYACVGEKDHKPYPVKLDLGRGILTINGVDFEKLDGVDSEVCAKVGWIGYRQSPRDGESQATICVATQGYASVTIAGPLGTINMECEQEKSERR